MGHEERMNEAIQQAEVERLIGPIREFRSRELLGCEKCGAPHDTFVVRWCSGKNRLSTKPQQCPFDGEHLHVLCQRCQYSYVEKTKDAATHTSSLIES